MNVTEAILTRRTAHAYKTTPIPEGLLEAALEGAIRAPNHKLTNPWRFIQVGPQTRAKMVDIIVDLKSQKRELGADAELKLRAKVSNSPVFLAVVQVIDADPERRKEDYASVACSIQNLSLVLWEAGVSSKWSTTAAIKDPRSYDILELDPDAEEIVGIVFAGYRADRPEPPRRPVAEVFRKMP